MSFTIMAYYLKKEYTGEKSKFLKIPRYKEKYVPVEIVARRIYSNEGKNYIAYLLKEEDGRIIALDEDQVYFIPKDDDE